MKISPPLLCALALLSCAVPRVQQAPAPPRTGEVILGVRRSFPPRIETLNAALVYLPSPDRAYLEFPYETLTCRQYWDLPARELFRTAVEAYGMDLDRGGPARQTAARERRAYGRFTTRTEWGVFPFMVNYAARPQVDLGYTFIGETPYFTLTQYGAESQGTTPENRAASPRISLYFTREWAEALALRFTAEALASLPAGP